jgi:hypothetical protein
MNDRLRPLSAQQGSMLIEPVFWPWPPPQDTLLHEHKMHDGRLSLFADKLGRFHLILRDNQENVLHDAISCIVKMPERMPTKLGFSWGDDVVMCMNGDWIISSKERHQIPDSIKLKPIKPQTHTDFTQQNTEAIAARDARLASWPVFPGKKRRTKDEVKTALDRAIRQIRDYVSLIGHGQDHHVESVSGALRRLIATGDPLPHLQLGAAFGKLPLIVFCDASPPTRELPGSSQSMTGVCWAKPTDANTNPVDLDVWLDTFWGRLGDNRLTHRDVITKLGDTVGAHFGFDMHPVEDFLSAAKSELGGVQADYLTRYLVQMAQVTAALGDFVIPRM